MNHSISEWMKCNPSFPSFPPFLPPPIQGAFEGLSCGKTGKVLGLDPSRVGVSGVSWSCTKGIGDRQDFRTVRCQKAVLWRKTTCRTPSCNAIAGYGFQSKARLRPCLG